MDQQKYLKLSEEEKARLRNPGLSGKSSADGSDFSSAILRLREMARYRAKTLKEMRVAGQYGDEYDRLLCDEISYLEAAKFLEWDMDVAKIGF